MAVNVFPAPSTGPAVPQGLRPPTFTYSNNWSLTSLPDITNAQNTTNIAMAYRKQDNSLYFTIGPNNTGLYKFDLTTQTSSRVSNNMTGQPRDLAIAQDGTIYRATNLSSTSGGINSTISWSTDAGVNFVGNVDSNTPDRGWLTVLDNGYISGITGNIVWVNRASTQASSSRVVVNNVDSGANVEFQNISNAFDIRGGVGLFSIRDGEDNPTANLFMLDSTTSSPSANWPGGTTTQGIYFRNAQFNFRRIASPSSFRYNVSHWAPVSTIGTQTPVFFSQNDMGRPTCIQNKWIVGVNKSTQGVRGVSLSVHDFENLFSYVGQSSLRIDTTAAVAISSNQFSNPIYIAATKKLYVMYANYEGGGSPGDARMYEYNVTTY
jgi:hypothetical protein